MFCRYCGARLDDAAQFCTTCGRQTAKAPTPPGAAPQPVAQRPAPVAQQPVPVAPRPAPVQPVPAPQGFAPAAPVPRRRGRKKAVVASLAALALLAVAGFAAWKLFFAPYDIDDKTFPDAAMRTYVASHVDADHDGKVSRDEAAAVEDLGVEGCAEVRGLGLFPNLHRLQLSGEALASVDVGDAPSLQELVVDGCPSLSKLDLGDKPHLWRLSASGTGLSEVDLSRAPALERANLKGAPLAALDVSANPALKTLACDNEVEVAGLEGTSLKTYWAVSEFVSETAGDGRITQDQAIGAKVEYDEQNRVSKQIIDYGFEGTYDPSYSVTYAYTGENRMPDTCSIADFDKQSSCAFGYDDEGRLVEVKEGDAAGRAFEYDDAGRLAAVPQPASDGSGETITCAYDAEGRLERVGKSVLAYNEAGLVTNIDTPNSLADPVYSYSYDEEGRCIGMHMEMAMGTYEDTHTFDNTMSYDETYAYDEAGRLTSASRATHSAANHFGIGYPPLDATFECDEAGNVRACEKVREDGKTDRYTASYVRLFGTEEHAPSGFQGVRLDAPLQPEVRTKPWYPSGASKPIAWELLVGQPDPLAILAG